MATIYSNFLAFLVTFSKNKLEHLAFCMFNMFTLSFINSTGPLKQSDSNIKLRTFLKTLDQAEKIYREQTCQLIVAELRRKNPRKSEKNMATIYSNFLAFLVTFSKNKRERFSFRKYFMSFINSIGPLKQSDSNIKLRIFLKTLDQAEKIYWEQTRQLIVAELQ